MAAKSRYATMLYLHVFRMLCAVSLLPSSVLHRSSTILKIVSYGWIFELFFKISAILDKAIEINIV